VAKHIPGPLYFQQQGATGTPMIFLHSTPDEHRLWLYQTAHFSAWYRTVAVDLAGYGRSPIPQDGVSLADQAEACWEVLDRVAPGQRAIVHGNSMGSFIAYHMVKQRPQQCHCLIMSGTGYIPGPVRQPMKVWRERYQKEGIALRHYQVLDHFSDAAKTQPAVRWYADMVCEMNNPGTVAAIVAMNGALMNAEPDSFWESCPVPLMIVSGTADRNHAAAEELHRRMKGSELRVIEGAGHAVMQEAPWQYDGYTIGFLDSLGLWPGPKPEGN
jgi:pimeloyl-ACP methyl ester carboxylesterase